MEKFSTLSGVFMLSLVRLLERAGYYGMRAILILYAIDEMGLGLSNNEAFSYYGYFSLLLGVMLFPAGVFTDLVLKQKGGTLLGLIIASAGYFMLWIPGFYAVIIGSVLISVGTGFTSINLIVLIGRLYAKEDRKRNQGIAIFHGMINIGSFLGVAGIGYIGELYGFRFGFLIAGACALLATIIFFITKEKLNLVEEQVGGATPPPVPIESSRPDILDEPTAKITRPLHTGFTSGKFLMILFLVFISVSFWWCYNLGTGVLMQGVIDGSFPRNSLFVDLVPPILSIGLIMVFAIYWFFNEVGSTINMIGLGMLGTVVYLLFMQYSVDSVPFKIYVTAGYLLVILGEFAVTVVMFSYFTRLSSVKYASMIMGGILTVIMLANSIFNHFKLNDFNINLLYVSILPLILGVLLLLFKKQLVRLTGGID